MRKYIEYPTVFAIGAIGYAMLEIIFRGFTHWSMFLAGGICFTFIYVLAAGRLNGIYLWAICAICITAVEFIVGVIVNLWLQLNVWDYSHWRFNIMGQICLLFSALWFALSIPATYISRLLRKQVFKH